MKILFLDVDGVLNSGLFYKTRFRENKSTPMSYMDDFDPIPMAILKEIIYMTGCNIVLSSTWRYPEDDFDKVQYALNAYGIEKDILDKTPRMPAGIHSRRGIGIEMWLSSNKHRDIESYLILDDNSGMLECQLPYFVKTSWEEGLREEHIDKCISILNGGEK